MSVPSGQTVEKLIASYKRSGLVDYAEPDYARYANATLPNDPQFVNGTLWALNNTGQAGGTPHADIDVINAWDILTSAENVVVAVLDSGVCYTHEDLASNMWTNKVDGTHGYNPIAGNNNPSDDQGHGTLVSGVLGAVGNNGKGVVGVAWKVQIMALKCLNSSSVGYDSDIIACIDFARTNGAKIINASLGSYTYSQSLSNAIVRARDDGIIFVTSCGNDSTDIDVRPYYPTSYHIDNIISVAYSTRKDTLGTYSSYGANTVHLAAPGEAMYSTFFTGSYLGGSYLYGTSMAAPYVSGTCALLLARYPNEPYSVIINRVLSGTDPQPSLTGKCITGGRLNVRKALSPPLKLDKTALMTDGLHIRFSGGPNRTFVIQASTNLSTWSGVYTNTTGIDGSLEIVEPLHDKGPHRFYRAVAAP